MEVGYKTTTFCLILVDRAIYIPLIAAGGIARGKACLPPWCSEQMLCDRSRFVAIDYESSAIFILKASKKRIC